MVTPVDFKTPENLLSKWAQHIDAGLLTQSGNVSGDFLNLVYLSLMPFRLTQQKYVNLLQMQGDRVQLENFMRMEKWIFDSPDQPATAFREFIQWFFQENRLIRDELTLAGRPVRLKNITAPLLNIFATKDHLVPPSASIPSGRACRAQGLPVLGSGCRTHRLVCRRQDAQDRSSCRHGLAETRRKLWMPHAAQPLLEALEQSAPLRHCRILGDREKNRTISRLASGPDASVKLPAEPPPDHACPASCTSQFSATAWPAPS